MRYAYRKRRITAAWEYKGLPSDVRIWANWSPGEITGVISFEDGLFMSTTGVLTMNNMLACLMSDISYK